MNIKKVNLNINIYKLKPIEDCESNKNFRKFLFKGEAMSFLIVTGLYRFYCAYF